MTDSKAPWLARGSAIALMMAAGIALAACGGGGGLNEDESAGIQQQLEDALAQATADAAARVTAEAEAAAAETAKATAEAEKATAEAEKAAADTARDLAVAEAAAAETAKATAVAEKATAEAEKVAADTAREAADTARDLAVAEAAAAETAKAAADAARELAVAARETAEAEAATARAATETAEDDAAAARTAQQEAKTAQDAAVVAQRAAEENATDQMTLAETANMAAKDAADKAEQADADLIVARDMQKQAEDERDDALRARDEAQRLLGLAQQATTAEEQRRQQAEAEQDRLEQVAEDARQEATQAQSQQVFVGMFTEAGTADPTVRASYNENASVTTTPAVTFSGKTGRAARPWYVTSFSNRTTTHVNRLQAYSDVENLPDVPFKDSTYNSENSVVNPQGEVVGHVEIAAGLRQDAASSSFPRRTGSEESFDVFSRGMTSTEFSSERSTIEADQTEDGNFDADDRNTQGFRDALKTAGITRSQYNQYVNGMRWRDTDRHPYRYSAERSGTLGGANGTFRCGGTTAATTCEVDYRGGTSYNFAGDGMWEFFPRSATVGVDVVDGIYMYFGYWSRQNLNPAQGETAWSFRAFHGGSTVGGDSSRDNNVDDVNGTATYSGPAIGYYAVYQPLGTQSGHGEFSATATLTADFDSDAETLEGRIDQFDGHSDWSLTLKRGTITSGAASVTTDGVIWSINNIPHEGGEWEAAFYSNLASDNRASVVPSGVAGTFEAEYSTVGRMIGAFGAHCRTGC